MGVLLTQGCILDPQYITLNLCLLDKYWSDFANVALSSSSLKLFLEFFLFKFKVSVLCTSVPIF